MERVGLPWRIKVGYGLCTAADYVPYNLFYIYFLYYLTDIVGVSAIIAGTIAFVVVVWDGIIDPLIGGFSDNYVTEKGRRLPWMKVSVAPLCVVIYLAFAPIEIKTAALQSAYYIAVPMLLWLFYSTFMVPYYALGAEITKDYNERNMLRFMTVFGGNLILVFVSSGPMWIWAWAESAGYDDRHAWGLVGAVFAVVTFVLCFCGIFLLGNCERASVKAALEAKKTKVKESFYKIWATCLRVKSFQKVTVWITVYAVGFVMIYSICVYIMTHNVGMDTEQQGVFWIIYVAVVVISMPFITFFANRVGKKPVVLAAMTPAVLAAMVFFFIGINSVLSVYVYAGLWGVSSASFFTFYVAFAYDCVEIVEYLTGDRKDGSLSAIATFCYQVGSALGMYGMGVVLERTGYDGMAEIQTEQALQGILTVGTLLPAIAVTVALLVLATYRVSKPKYALLRTALVQKKAGNDYSAEGFKDIL